MNEVNILGRLTSEPDMRYLSSGSALVMFTLAVQRSYKNKQGEYDADFIRCKAFGKTAEVLAEYLTKGNRVAVSGEIQTSTYEKEGQTHYATDVSVRQFTFIDSKDKGEKKSYEKKESGGGQPTKDPFESYSDPVDIQDSDLPF